MKAKTFFLTSLDAMRLANDYLLQVILDGKVKVTFSDAGTKSDKQRGLQWKWYGDVARAGIGGKHEDTANGVHLLSKYRWAVPIFLRDDTAFAGLYEVFMTKYEGNQEMISYFVEHHVSTEKFSVSQTAEFLKCFHDHYGRIGVNLTIPAFRGLMDD